jgi:hypothetical protein
MKGRGAILPHWVRGVKETGRAGITKVRRGGQKSICTEFVGCATAFDMAASPCVRSIQQMLGTHEVQYKTRFGVSGYS